MSFTWRNSTYDEYVSKDPRGASPIEVWENDRVRITRIYNVDWDTHRQAVVDLLGWSVRTSAGGATITRQLPHGYPAYKSIPNAGTVPAYCVKVSVQGFGVPDDSNMKDGNGVARYKKARLTAEYASLPYPVGNDGPVLESSLSRYVQRPIRPIARYLTLPTGCMMLEGETVSIYQPIGKTVIDFDLIFIWHDVPQTAVPLAHIAATATLCAADLLLGTINSDIFDGYPIGTLLLTGVVTKESTNVLGYLIYTVEYHMRYTPNGHNAVPYLASATSFTYRRLSVNGGVYADTPANDGRHIFNARPFILLFLPP